MNLLKQKRAALEWLSCFLVFFIAAGVFIRPQAAVSGAAAGISLCIDTLIPALFPFMILSKLLLKSRAAGLCVFLYPYTRLLGIRSKKAPAALFCGILGGFAPGAAAVDHLFKSGEISKEQAGLLLVCCIGAGPGFVINGVGAAMLESAGTGRLLFASQLITQLLCGLAASIMLRARAHSCGIHAEPAVCCLAPQKKPDAPSCASFGANFCSAVQESVSACLSLCGTVIFFSFLCRMLAPSSCGPRTQFFICLPLELTCACRFACASGCAERTVYCCIALSLMGACVFLQVRALVSSAISLVPLFCFRMLHALCAPAVFLMLAKLFPHALAAGAVLGQRPVYAVRMPADVMVCLFLLCALACGFFPHCGSLRTHRNDV